MLKNGAITTRKREVPQLRCRNPPEIPQRCRILVDWMTQPEIQFNSTMLVFKHSAFELLDQTDNQPGFLVTFADRAVIRFLARFTLATGKLSVPGQNLPRHAKSDQVLSLPFDNGDPDPCCIQSSCLATGLQSFGAWKH